MVTATGRDEGAVVEGPVEPSEVVTITVLALSGWAVAVVWVSDEL